MDLSIKSIGLHDNILNDNIDILNPVAVNSDDEDIPNTLPPMINQDAYRDIEEVFNRVNSQRQFFTVHHSIPNDQEAFARWCYKMPPTCKTDQSKCLNYQDLRLKYG